MLVYGTCRSTLIRPVYKTQARNFSPGCVKTFESCDYQCNHHIRTCLLYAHLIAMMPKGKCAHAIEGRPSANVQ